MYPISDEFFPYSKITPPTSRLLAALAGKILRPPGFVRRDPEIKAEKLRFPGFGGAALELLLLSPAGVAEPSPALVYFHGGGFVMEAAPYHYRLAMLYAKEAACRVFFVRYRLAPKHPYPIPTEDCFEAFRWVCENAEALGVDPGRIGLGGDSAGGNLCAAVCLMARDRGCAAAPRFQMMVYPFLDQSLSSGSSQSLADAPMWNTRRSRIVQPMFLGDMSAPYPAYASPVHAEDFSGLPPAYIETAEFDSLRDDGTLYARLLGEAGVPAELNETKGTMHGFDIVTDAPTSRAAIGRRIEFMRNYFA